jgi:transcription elongation factor Elf1
VSLSNQKVAGCPAPLTASRLRGDATHCSPLDNNAASPVDNWFTYSFTHDGLDPSISIDPVEATCASRHKCTFVSCCAEQCEQTFLRKDHLTQHIRNKHQDLDTKFCCPIYGCTDHSFSLLRLFEHMQQFGHRVMCTSPQSRTRLRSRSAHAVIVSSSLVDARLAASISFDTQTVDGVHDAVVFCFSIRLFTSHGLYRHFDRRIHYISLRDIPYHIEQALRPMQFAFFVFRQNIFGITKSLALR